MSNQNKNKNLVFDNKNKNINLISIEKSPNKDIKLNFPQENNNFNINLKNVPNNNPKKNDLLNSKMDEESIISNIKIEEEQKQRHYADILFTEEDDKEIINQVNNKKGLNKNLSVNNLSVNDSSKDISVSLDEGKRIDLANKLFGNSLSSSIKSNTINDLSISLISEKRKEVADKLFDSNSDMSFKKKSLNETVKSFKSNQSNMSHVINNLSGSNAGLNINAFANKCTNIDNAINENEIESSMYKIKQNENNSNNISKSVNEYNDIDEQMENEVCFKNLIDINKFGNEKNKSNNLNDISASFKKDRKENSLIKSYQKNDLMNNSKEIKNENKKIIHESVKKENLNYNIKENNENNISNSELSISNIIIDELPKNVNKIKENKKIIIDDSMKKEKDDEDINKNKINIPKKKNPLDIFKKNNKLKKKEEKKIDIIDQDIEEETSNEILNKKIRLEKIENNESSFLNNIPSRISIEDESNNNKSIIKRNTNEKIQKKQLILDKTQEKEKNKENLDTLDNFIAKNKLISEKNIIKLESGRTNFSNEKKGSKFIKLKKKLSNEYEDDFKNQDDDKDEKVFKKSNKNNNNIIKKDKDEKGLNLIYFDDKNLNREKRFKDFLNEKKLFYNDKIYNSKDNENDLKQIKDNKYFENIIINQETLYDIISQKQNKKKFEMPVYYETMKKSYEENIKNFTSIFQFISIDNKEKCYKSYEKIHNYNIKNYHISPYLNDIKEFYKSFKIQNKNNDMEYIRYTIEENEGETFYGCFMFSLIEKYILNKNKKGLYMLILDIFKLYDLSSNIYNSDPNNILIYFSIIYEYIELNMWEKAYDLFNFLFSKIEQTLIEYIKGNIFLYLSKIYSLYDNNNSNYLNQYQKIIINYNEPSKIVFQLIPFIFGINLEIIYYENKNEEDILTNNLSFSLPSNIIKNEKIYIIYYNNCYHIGYERNIFNKNNKILNKLKTNLNKISLVQYIVKENLYCQICDGNSDIIEIIDDKNKKICKECLKSKIDEYLIKRISFINDDCKSNYINYSFYLRPIELILKEQNSLKNNIDNTITIKNTDYFILFQKTFNERISELLKDSNTLKNSLMNINRINSINQEINNNIENIENNNGDCLICQKSSNIMSINCGCTFCEDCLYELLSNITNNQIILNGYEKLKLFSEDGNKCPFCQNKINLQNLIMQFEERGRNFENEYNEAKIRMKNYIKTQCFICEKKFDNGKRLEVTHNSKRELLLLNVMINKFCIKDMKTELNNNADIELENEIDYCQTPHIICLNCYRKNKNAKIKEIRNIEYKLIMCNICGIRHYINFKDWEKWNRNDTCCKCNIF